MVEVEVVEVDVEVVEVEVVEVEVVEVDVVEVVEVVVVTGAGMLFPPFQRTNFIFIIGLITPFTLSL